MIERTLQDGILTLRFCHGKANALDLEFLEALVREFEGIPEDVRAVVLTGKGSIFSAGVDLVRFGKEGADYAKRFVPQLCTFVQKLFMLPRPVISAVNGHAIAGGAIVVLASDFRLMAEGKGLIGLPELLVGVPFPAAALEVVRFAVRRDKQQSLIYTGRTIGPRDALADGLVDEVTSPDALLARAQEIAHHMAKIPPAVFRLTKQALRTEALARMEKMSAEMDPLARALWSAPETLAHIQEYMGRTMRK